MTCLVFDLCNILYTQQSEMLPVVRLWLRGGSFTTKPTMITMKDQSSIHLPGIVHDRPSSNPPVQSIWSSAATYLKHGARGQP